MNWKWLRTCITSSETTCELSKNAIQNTLTNFKQRDGLSKISTSVKEGFTMTTRADGADLEIWELLSALLCWISLEVLACLFRMAEDTAPQLKCIFSQTMPFCLSKTFECWGSVSTGQFSTNLTWNYSVLLSFASLCTFALSWRQKMWPAKTIINLTARAPWHQS